MKILCDEIVNVRIYGRKPAVIRRMADGSPSKRLCRISIANPATPGVPLRWPETQEEEELPQAQQSQPVGARRIGLTDLGYPNGEEYYRPGRQTDQFSDGENGEDAGQAPYSSVGRPVPLNTSDGEDDNGEEWVSPRKQVRFSGGDGGAASAGGTGGAAHEPVDEHQGKEDDDYEGCFADEAVESHAGNYDAYTQSHFEEEWRKEYEEEEDGTAENREESAAEAQIHEETESDSEVEGNEATAKEAAGPSKELWKENGAAAEAGAAEDFPDLPQTQEYVAPEDAAEAGAGDAAGRAESPVMKGHCDYCQNEVWSYQERGRMRRRGQDVLVHKTCREEAKKAEKKALQVEVVQVVRKCYVCKQDIAAEDHVQTQHGSRHKSC